MLFISHPDISPSASLVESLRRLAASLGKDFAQMSLTPEETRLAADGEESMLLLCVPQKKSIIQKYLNACRELRIPYLFLPHPEAACHFRHLLVPVSFLEEEVGKAQYVAAFGRFCQSEITLLQAHDYGSKAQQNVQKTTALLDKFQLSHQTRMGNSDSFHIDREALNLAANIGADLLVVSASRDYGLDDLLFGPKERHLIARASVPVMLVNPRGDLFSLCD